MLADEPGLKGTVEDGGCDPAQQATHHQDVEIVEVFGDAGQTIQNTIQDTVRSATTANIKME